jgi:vacuolar protein sorting-associated protein 54
MKKINWEAASIGVNPYVETLTKETATLQKVLAKHLPEETVASIMQPVFASYREQWSRAYGEVVVRSMGAKERWVTFCCFYWLCVMLIVHRLLADAEFFSNRISRLDGAGDLGDYIVNVVKAKAITIDPSAAKRTSMEKPAPVQAPTTEEEKKSGGQAATSAPAPVPEVGGNEAVSK